MNSRYNKFVVAFLGAVATILTTYFQSQHWVPAVLSLISAISVMLIPNSKNQIDPLPPPKNRT